MFLSVSPYGIELTNDSKSYVAAARSFLESGVMLDYYGNKFTLWPPVFPLLISIFYPHHIYFLKFVHLGFWLFIIWVFNKRIKDWKFLVLVFTSIYPLHLGRFIWSESLFIYLFSIILYGLQRKWRYDFNALFCP